MKKTLLIFSLLTLATPFAQPAWSDGPEFVEPVRRSSRKAVVVEETVAIAPAPICVGKSATPKVKLLSWDPTQKVAKFLGEIQECVTTQWDVLRMLSGPNAINLRYPEEMERWSYLWLWSYKLQNPMEDTLILMDKPGKRILKGKNPVELYLTFNKDDVVERIELDLIKKKNSQYVISNSF